MAQPTGFHSSQHRLAFEQGRERFQRGGPCAEACGARTRAGSPCLDVPLGDGGGRCLRHAGPKAARAYRERQLAQMQTGALAPDAFARAEARRARNALLDAWKKNPAVPGATIDLGPDEADFGAAAGRLGVNVAALYPAVADWLRWRWQRHGIDCPSEATWLRAVREVLPRKITAADAAMVWVRLGAHDKRTRAGRAIKAALRAGGIARAEAVATQLDLTVRMEAIVRRRQAPRPLTGLPVRPWPQPAIKATGKRHQPDRLRFGTPAPPKALGRIGRPPRVPDDPDEIAELVGVLRAAGSQVSRLWQGIGREDDRLRFLRALRDFTCDPNDQAARERWMHWVTRAC